MTPLQQQYNRIKAEYPDTILFFRMGDFYEGFGEDAKVMAKVLGITLTSRNKKKDDPMAGVPHHAIDAYLYKMVVAGYKVAICEQLEDPKDAKGIVKRGVIKVVTPGTITDEKAIDVTSNNYIVAINIKDGLCSISLADVNTGEFRTTELGARTDIDRKRIIDEISRLSPSEILLSKNDQQRFKEEYKQLLSYYVQYVEEDYFNEKDNKSELEDFFKVKNLKGFGIENRNLCVSTAGALVKYLKETQKNDLSHINKIQFFNLTDHMLLDSATMRNLELVFSTSGNKRASLIGVLDETKTSMGARLLRSWILQPLIEKEKIEERIEAVDAFVQEPEKNDKCREVLSEVYDLERLASKLGSGNANPKDIIALKTSLENIPSLATTIPGRDAKRDDVGKDALQCVSADKEQNSCRGVLQYAPTKLLSIITAELQTSKFDSLIKLIDSAIKENPSAFTNEGGIMKDGYNAELDEIREAAFGGKEWIKKLQAREIERTGIPTLKVKFNKVFGYFIEVSKAQQGKVPDDYIRKQTLVNCERFFTPELKDMEGKILGAQDKMIEMEYKLFCEIRDETAKYIVEIQRLAHHVAILDVIANFAYIARYYNYAKPEFNDEGIIEVKDGRHPIVEKLSEEPFVPNDVKLNDEDQKLIILTGPNMSGKSTYIRQVAIIVLMAQIGSFVPAKSANIFVTDRIFTRVGASDDLSAGESTFMVEMNETANILNNATERSLIILDEVGRGTSTYDGVSIAWAVAEYLHNTVKAYTLFATHYHELIKLEQTLEKAKNYNVAVKETLISPPYQGGVARQSRAEGVVEEQIKSRDKQIVFLRKIVKGGTDQSYGVHVAELAGLPEDVIGKAKEILAGLEQESMFEINRNPLLPEEGSIAKQSGVVGEIDQESTPQIGFFVNPTIQTEDKIAMKTDPKLEKLKEELENIDINNITPLQALKKLEEMKDNLK